MLGGAGHVGRAYREGRGTLGGAHREGRGGAHWAGTPGGEGHAGWGTPEGWGVGAEPYLLQYVALAQRHQPSVQLHQLVCVGLRVAGRAQQAAPRAPGPSLSSGPTHMRA